MPLDQDIEGRYGEREPGVELRPDSMHDLFDMADDGQHRQHRLYQQAVLPLPALTQAEVGGIALRGMEGSITENNHPAIKLPNEPLKGVIGDVGGGTRPPHDQPPLVEQQAEFAPDNPAVIREAFATNLLRAAAFTHRMDQFDPVRVDDPQHRRGGQEDLRPGLMRLEEAKKPGALGELRKPHSTGFSGSGVQARTDSLPR